MQCSSRKFVASQVFYGTQIAHPRWSQKRLVKYTVETADLLLKTLDAKKKKVKK